MATSEKPRDTPRRATALGVQKGSPPLTSLLVLLKPPMKDTLSSSQAPSRTRKRHSLGWRMDKTSQEGQRTQGSEKDWAVPRLLKLSLLGRPKCCPLGDFSRLSNLQSWHVPESSTGTLRSKAWPPLLSLQVTKSLPALQTSVLGEDSLLGHSDSVNPVPQTSSVAPKAVQRDKAWPPWLQHRAWTKGRSQVCMCMWAVGLWLGGRASREARETKRLGSETRHIGEQHSVKMRSRIYPQPWEGTAKPQSPLTHHSWPARPPESQQPGTQHAVRPAHSLTSLPAGRSQGPGLGPETNYSRLATLVSSGRLQWWAVPRPMSQMKRVKHRALVTCSWKGAAIGIGLKPPGSRERSRRPGH